MRTMVRLIQIRSADQTVLVPMLDTHETLDYPIIGYNVIEELVRNNKVSDQIAGEWAVSFASVCYEKNTIPCKFYPSPIT